MEETRKHKNHYFPTSKRHQTKKNTMDEQSGNTISDTVTYNAQKPVNFLFSNENDFDDDDDD